MFSIMCLLCVSFLVMGFLRFDVDQFNTDFNLLYTDGYMCDSPFYVLPKAGLEKVPVPCGRCPPCKLRRVNSWVFRLLEECKVSLSSHFVTLTYDTRFVPISENGFMTLRKRDFQLFMKRLRKLCPDSRLKYYAVGEYGTNNKRPHYHAIIFNCPDIGLYHVAWGLGQIDVGTVTSDSVAYCLKYIDKPSVGKLHSRDDRESEFPLMSKALGVSYLSDEVINYHQADLSRLFVTKEGGHRIALPRYFRHKIYSDVDLKKQPILIQAAIEDQDIADRLEFSRLGYPASYSYEAWKESKRFGRYEHFYSSQNGRDL